MRLSCVSGAPTRAGAARPPRAAPALADPEPGDQVRPRGLREGPGDRRAPQPSSSAGRSWPRPPATRPGCSEAPGWLRQHLPARERSCCRAGGPPVVSWAVWRAWCRGGRPSGGPLPHRPLRASSACPSAPVPGEAGSSFWCLSLCLLLWGRVLWSWPGLLGGSQASRMLPAWEGGDLGATRRVVGGEGWCRGRRI